MKKIKTILAVLMVFTMVLSLTAGGSGIGRSGPNMEALAGSGIWLEGKRFSGNVSEADLQSWIDGLK